MIGLTETRDAGALNTFLKTNGVNLDVASDAWCAGFVNANLKSLGIGGSGSQVATSFLGWGSKVQDLSKVLPGDVLVEARGLSQGQTGGHVGIATGGTRSGKSGLELEMISGNSSNAVKRTWESANDVTGRRGSFDDLGSSLKDASTSATDAAKGVGSLTSDMSALPGSLTQVSQGLGQLGSALGASGVPGGGLVGILGKLLGLAGGGSNGAGGGSSGFTDLGNGAVMVAGGGHVRGPGTSTSDSIPARLSNGEFVVNAASASRHLDLLHAMNENRLPAFAEGGRVTPLPSIRGSRSGGSGGMNAGGGDPGGLNVTFINQSGTPLQAGETRRNPDGSYTQVLRSAEGGLAQRARRGQGPFADAAGGAAFRRG